MGVTKYGALIGTPGYVVEVWYLLDRGRPVLLTAKLPSGERDARDFRAEYPELARKVDQALERHVDSAKDQLLRSLREEIAELRAERDAFAQATAPPLRARAAKRCQRCAEGQPLTFIDGEWVHTFYGTNERTTWRCSAHNRWGRLRWR